MMSLRVPKLLFHWALLVTLGALLLISACETTGGAGGLPAASAGSKGRIVNSTLAPVKLNAAGAVQGAEDVPIHMANRDVVRIGVLLPFTHRTQNVRDQANSIMKAIEMGMFDHADGRYLILRFDTEGTANGVEQAAQSAIAAGVQIILGPLFSGEVSIVSNMANQVNVPVLAFSNDRYVAGDGVFLTSVGLEEEVKEIIDFARTRGIESYAFLGPDSDYGRRVASALKEEVERRDGRVIASNFYVQEDSDAPLRAARVVAKAMQREVERVPRRVAVLVPESGVKLRSVAPLLPYSGLDTRYAVFLGTSQWDDPSVWREPTLINGYFVAPPRETFRKFVDDYERIFGEEPSRLAPLGYDVATVTAKLASAGKGFSAEVLSSEDGFVGVNGLFRFRIDGTAERSLSILRITQRSNAVEIRAGSRNFGYAEQANVSEETVSTINFWYPDRGGDECEENCDVIPLISTSIMDSTDELN